MLIEASNLIGLALGSIEESKRLGNVANILVDKNNAKVIGLIVKAGNILFYKELFLADMDILDIDRNGIATRSEENLIDPYEIIKAKKILISRFNLVGLPVFTKSDKKLGRISDYVIDSSSLQVVKFYIKGWLEDRIISINNVVKITTKKIVIKDDILQNRSKLSTKNNYETN